MGFNMELHRFFFGSIVRFIINLFYIKKIHRGGGGQKIEKKEDVINGWPLKLVQQFSHSYVSLFSFKIRTIQPYLSWNETFNQLKLICNNLLQLFSSTRLYGKIKLFLYWNCRVSCWTVRVNVPHIFIVLIIWSVYWIRFDLLLSILGSILYNQFRIILIS